MNRQKAPFDTLWSILSGSIFPYRVQMRKALSQLAGMCRVIKSQDKVNQIPPAGKIQFGMLALLRHKDKDLKKILAPQRKRRDSLSGRNEGFGKFVTSGASTSELIQGPRIFNQIDGNLW